jgi:hypothetical protein
MNYKSFLTFLITTMIASSAQTRASPNSPFTPTDAQPSPTLITTIYNPSPTDTKDLTRLAGDTRANNNSMPGWGSNNAPSSGNFPRNANGGRFLGVISREGYGYTPHYPDGYAPLAAKQGVSDYYKSLRSDGPYVPIPANQWRGPTQNAAQAHSRDVIDNDSMDILFGRIGPSPND